jgi:hypothetical protein
VLSLTHEGDVNGLTVQGNGATLAVGATTALAAMVTESNNLALGSGTSDHATLAIAAASTYALMGDVGVYGTLGGGGVVGTIANAGLLEKLGGISSSGGSAIQAALVNTGTVLVQHGNMVLQTAATNDALIDVVGGLTLNAALGADAGRSGTIVLMPTGTLVANGSIAASQTVTFDPGGLIAIGNSALFAATILGFATGDTIELTNATATAASYSGGVITITNGATTLEMLNAPGLTNPAGLTVNNDGQGNSYLVELACFAGGTRILTSTGEVPVEALRVGDLVPGLVSGRLRRVRWIGSREVDCARHPEPAQVYPVRVRMDAFAPGVPSRDVLLSRDHALALEGGLIPVRHLIDGAWVVRERADHVTYWHIELDAHDVVLADGLPAESYLDSGNRMGFGGGMSVPLHADFTRHVWEAGACLPLVCAGPEVAIALARLRAGAPKQEARAGVLF